MNKYDIAIVGGGMVGAALAVGFAKQGRKVAVIEGHKPTPYSPDQSMDIRVSAISEASVRLLEQLGAWQHTVQKRVCPYRRLETWEHPECRTRFSAQEMQLDQLGYIVENRLIQLGLWQEFEQYDNLDVLCSEELDTMTFGEEDNHLHLVSGKTVQASWVVGADGANSKVRRLSGIGITAWDYRQHCMLINVETEQDQQDITWQQFLPSGPRSFLPLCGQQGSLVWYDSPKRIKQLMALNHTQLEQEIVRHFPQELGGITVLQKGAFPLTRRHAQTYINQRCVLVGDAAHTINPLAGQGVNLGFKDAQCLLDVTAEKALTPEGMKQYQQRRYPDNLLMQTGMDVFYKGFSNQLPPLQFARNALLKLAEHSGPIKQQVLKYALGL
ncbi:2-octaprenyl-3-methyl-6-methoxy-1,4-benzoquinol hydroxylase [Vibrio astriarenae]|uniref:2-octaprenyl-3-methyl-6-methoxy-1,4-benzoquinol hydroxylase n=1 Tax=Vibrio astriarenae TaxID=1481923 RepID=A0A7Z2T1V6_9VIBR|nr:2-octaprenyl-3-methyl-6-methoxy-1,4-benzoquinol hydroxylase [Vibrio astriarenae]QIA62725.1 2-octaprenyl-3-methyl-6-methoxy-1,4-benzoquinol hydroxylase [Vibrio astriarenae]